MKEIWKSIPGWEGYYEISNHGRVKSLKRYMNHHRGGVSRVREKILIPNLGKNGYYTLLFSKNSKTKQFYLHRIITEAFIPNPENKRTVNHINGITTCNDLDNLEWATYSENHIHAFNVLGRKASSLGKFGYESHKGKIVQQYSKDDEFIKEYGSVAEAERHTGIKQRSIARVCRKERPYTGGFKWKYI